MILFEDQRLENLIFALICGTPTPRKLKSYDLWDYEPGVRFFASLFLDRAEFKIKRDKRKIQFANLYLK